MNTLRHGDEAEFASTVAIPQRFPEGVRHRATSASPRRQAVRHAGTSVLRTCRHALAAQSVAPGRGVMRRDGCHNHELLARVVAEILWAGHERRLAQAASFKQTVWPEKRKEFVAFSRLKASDNPC